MASAEQRAAAVAAQKAQTQADDARNAVVQSQIDAADANFRNPSLYQVEPDKQGGLQYKNAQELEAYQKAEYDKLTQQQKDQLENQRIQTEIKRQEIQGKILSSDYWTQQQGLKERADYNFRKPSVEQIDYPTKEGGHFTTHYTLDLKEDLVLGDGVSPGESSQVVESRRVLSPHHQDIPPILTDDPKRIAQIKKENEQIKKDNLKIQSDRKANILY